ncbi:formate dehydrogenase accessory protein FdhE [Comamonas kerstersii]|uniref:formate dehydrogenase accessory protein FdhE n=1 Tax=Comamonas kerstersii TaxID=225992 RepID=UPI0009856911|nr:formate dehydrogenase accessory protein FdhE [Comamonas kerstersii]OOH85183.1 formate dehydrogenase accessory protein FdhE [Comamonas kerstersii]OOH92223.1 formate dehydrogenase accessory protein FdhE [Comamonas kerstersii]QTW17554.1 formate dehydrogenase accessory protein FdhE [Comamonas kerstersii]
MQTRILQPGEIEALDKTSFPRVLLPQVSTLFAERAARLRQLADGNPIADYLQFAAKIVDAQHAAAGSVELQPMDRSNIERSQQFSMPLLPAADHIDPAWQQVLNAMLDTLSGSEGLPEPLQPLLQSLRDLSQDERDTIAKRLLQKEVAARHIGMAPFIMAALQVTYAKRAAALDVEDVPYTDPATICPVCASEPVSSVLRIGGKANGHRYLHCGTCCTEWQLVRVKCSHCESTKGIHYQSVEGSKEVVTAETCDECGTYRKVVNQEKDPMAEPLADDLATLTLDLLMSENTQFKRASANPLLFVAVAEEQTDAQSAELVDPAAE